MYVPRNQVPSGQKARSAVSEASPQVPKEAQVSTPAQKPIDAKPLKKLKAKVEAKKTAPKKAEKSPQKEKKDLVQIKGAQLLKTGPGPAMLKLQNKLKAAPVQGQCDVRGCNAKAASPRAFRCLKHRKAIRKLQLKANNAVWRRRVKAGTAGHHVVYRRAATVFTLKNRPLAEKIVMAGRATVTTKTELEKAIRAVPVEARKEVRRTN